MSYSVCTNENGYMVEQAVCEYISQSMHVAQRLSYSMNKPVFVLNQYMGDWIVDMFTNGKCLLSGRFHNQEDAMYWMLSVKQ